MKKGVTDKIKFFNLLSLLFCLYILLIVSCVAIDTENVLNQLWIKQCDGDVYDVSISNEGSYIAVGMDNYLYVLNDKGELLWKFLRLNHAIHNVAIADSGEVVAAVSIDKFPESYYYGKTVLQLYWKEGFIIKYWQGSWDRILEEKIKNLIISNDGSKIAIGLENNYVYLIDRDGNLLWKKEINQKLSDIALSDAGNDLIVTGVDHIYSFDKTGYLYWDGSIEEEINANINSVVVSKDGKKAIIGLENGDIVSFNIGFIKSSWKYSLQSKVQDLAISKDNSQIIALTNESIFFFNQAGVLLKKSNITNQFSSIDISNDGTSIISAIGRQATYQTITNTNSITNINPVFIITPLFILLTIGLVFFLKNKKKIPKITKSPFPQNQQKIRINPKIQKILNEIVKINGIDIINDPKKFKGFLSDFCGDLYEKETILLMLTIEQNIPQELLKAYQSGTLEIKKTGLKQRLLDLAIEKDTVDSLIDSWIEALNLL